jgi:hypothetical protein
VQQRFDNPAFAPAVPTTRAGGYAAEPLWPIVAETTDRTVAAWERLAEKDLLPEKMGAGIGDQILSVAKTVARTK